MVGLEKDGRRVCKELGEFQPVFAQRPGHEFLGHLGDEDDADLAALGDDVLNDLGRTAFPKGNGVLRLFG